LDRIVALVADRWYIPESEVIDWHEWGDEFVALVVSRAETHLLSPAAGSVLLALLESRSSLALDALYAKAFLVQEPGSDGSPAMTADERNSLRAIVADFERLGIASRQIA
jgi:hypothetical protein